MVIEIPKSVYFLTSRFRKMQYNNRILYFSVYATTDKWLLFSKDPGSESQHWEEFSFLKYVQTCRATQAGSCAVGTGLLSQRRTGRDV